MFNIISANCTGV